MSTCRLIVHADDFGLSSSVNNGILEAHRRGIVTSASVIAPGEAFDHALSLAKEAPSLDLGVHLTLVGERPILPRTEIPSLVRADGNLHESAAAFMKRYLRGAISFDEVSRELDAQIKAVLDGGVRVTHLDSHQHLHVLPGIRRIVGRLAVNYAIQAIRHPAERVSSYMFSRGWTAGRIVQLVILNAFCTATRATDVHRPDRFFGFYFGGRLTKRNLLAILRSLPTRGICELMCHPGLTDPLSRHGHWNYSWQEELDALTDVEVRDRLAAEGVVLTSYAEFAE